MASLSRFNGAAATGAFYGYTPLVIKIACTGGFLANATAADGAITEKGYEKTVRAVQQFGSIIWLGSQNDDVFTAIVDGASFNKAGANAFDALATAVTAVKDAGTVAITSSSALNGAGTFTFA